MKDQDTESVDSGAPSPRNERVVLNGSDIERVLKRISYEIIEANKGVDNLVILGIPRRGFPLAQRIARNISAETGVDAETLVGQLDVTMYRDDLRRSKSRTPAPTKLPAQGIDGKTVVLVDDVLFSGRTIRAALDAMVDLGRPRVVRLAVLVDRGHRELPIRADHVGKNLPTAQSERVKVHLEETDERDGVGVNEVVILNAGEQQ